MGQALFLSLKSTVLLAVLLGVPQLATATATDLKPRVLELNIDDLQARYAADCPQTQSARSCFLPSTLLDPSQSGHVLIFRGENRRFERPLSSPLNRSQQIPSELCATAACSKSQILAKVSQLVSNLIRHVSKSQPGSGAYGDYQYENGQWNRISGAGEPLFEDKKSPAVMEVLAGSHFRGDLQRLEIFSSRREGDQTQSLDPFVSFSPSPAVAKKFAKSYEGSGRIWVLSVPRSAVVKVSRSQCRDGRFLEAATSAQKLYDFSECSRSRVYESEIELDAIFETPASWPLGFIRGF